MRAKPTPANIVILAAGALMLLGSFLAFYELRAPSLRLGDVRIGGTESATVWEFGFFSLPTLAVWFGVVMAGHVALTTFVPGVRVPPRVLGLSWEQIHLALGFQSAVFMGAYLIRDKSILDFGLGFYLMFLAAIGLVVGAILRTLAPAGGPSSPTA
jgi:hypothetical protein